MSRPCCACGCGELLVGKRRHARYVDATHRKRGSRAGGGAAESVTFADPGHGSPDPLGTVSGGYIDAQATAEAMRRGLDALTEEFDRAGSTTAMRQEGRALGEALGLPRPRWLPTDHWRSDALPMLRVGP